MSGLDQPAPAGLARFVKGRPGLYDDLRTVQQDAGELVVLGEHTGTGGRVASEAAASGRMACSFTGDTDVLMADGTHKPIKDIQVGDEVLAADPKTGERSPRRVTALIVHQDTVLDLVTDNGSRVTTTEDHPFWNATDGSWERTDQLDPGDALLTADGDTVRVVGLDPTSKRAATAYNLTVAGIHTYHVMAGDLPVLVHNTC